VSFKWSAIKSEYCSVQYFRDAICIRAESVFICFNLLDLLVIGHMLDIDYCYAYKCCIINRISEDGVSRNNVHCSFSLNTNNLTELKCQCDSSSLSNKNRDY
jgi:hypothetical protein